MDQARRLFLLNAARLASLAALGIGLHRAGSGASLLPQGYPFSLGVASGSPLPDSVVLWTRILPDPLNSAAMPAVALPVRWEMAEDEAFARIAAKGLAAALPALAHSVHVEVPALAPDRWYWYRFMFGDAVSPVGRTRTAPQADALPGLLRLAVASCQHWEFGTYAAHRHIAAAAPDLIAFLGDYIYEWGPYQLEHPAAARRVDESFTLDAYRARYAQYKSDPQLQAAHLAAPWIVTWDDHEVANDYANERDERLDPDFAARRASAYQAFYEHMPVRLASGNGFGSLRIHQRYDWGRLARFHVLDSRQYRTYQACSKPGRGGSNSVHRHDCNALQEPARSMLGAEQEAWLRAGLTTSKARWNILAQQTLMAPSSQTPILRAGDGRIWTDGWDGYPLARERIYDAFESSAAANPIVLAGDVHTFYAADLRRDVGAPVSAQNPVLATEFCGTSVSSSSRPQARTEQYLAYNPHIKYGRSDKRGFMLLEITPSQTTTLFQGLADVHDKDSPLATLATFVVADGKPGTGRQ